MCVYIYIYIYIHMVATVKDLPTTGTGARKYLKSTLKHKFLIGLLRTSIYNFSGLGIRVAWKLFIHLGCVGDRQDESRNTFQRQLPEASETKITTRAPGSKAAQFFRERRFEKLPLVNTVRVTLDVTIRASLSIK